MKHLLITILLTIPLISNTIEGEFSPTLVRQSKQQLINRVTLLLTQIPIDEARYISHKLQEIEILPLPPVSPQKTLLLSGPRESQPIIFIQGLPAKKREYRNFEWAHMLYMMHHQPYTIYFLKIDRKKRLTENGKILLKQIIAIQEIEKQPITIFAHCTGGAALLAGINTLTDSTDSTTIALLERMKIITMGSPMNDYHAPAIMGAIQGVFPKTRLVLDLGRYGLSAVALPPSLSGTHYITDYRYDHTNTNIKGKYLQIRTASAVDSFSQALHQMAMPFGPESSILLHQESHFSMIEAILSRELNVYDKGRPLTGDLIQPLKSHNETTTK